MPSDGSVLKATFCTYKRLLIKLVGRGPMDDAKINEIGQLEFGERWGGVWAKQNFCGCETGSLLQTRLQGVGAAPTGLEST